MSDWQPIETAPKDGTEVLAWDGSYLWIVEYMTGTWLTPRDEGWMRLHVTHWMPLPEPPRQDHGQD